MSASDIRASRRRSGSGPIGWIVSIAVRKESLQGHAQTVYPGRRWAKFTETIPLHKHIGHRSIQIWSARSEEINLSAVIGKSATPRPVDRDAISDSHPCAEGAE